MTAPENGHKLIRHESEAGCWNLAMQNPSSALAPWVLRYTGYREYAPCAAVTRREVPSTVVGLIINFGSLFTIRDPRPNAPWIKRDTFIAGLHDSHALVESDGRSHCLQIDFTPLGACRFFGTGLGDINHATTPLDEVFGPGSAVWVERLNTVGNWRARFQWVEHWLLRRFATATAPHPEVEAAWTLLRASRGTAKIAEVARRLGRSREHVSRLVRAELGMSPKSLARVIRFEQACGRLQRGGAKLVDIALAAGYADQSHFIADFNSMAGCTPGELLRHSVGESGVIERRT